MNPLLPPAIALAATTMLATQITINHLLNVEAKGSKPPPRIKAFLFPELEEPEPKNLYNQPFRRKSP